MVLEKEVAKRSLNQCELCSAQSDLEIYVVCPKSGTHLNEVLHMCTNCKQQIDSRVYNNHHWRCLNDKMWSEIDAVKVMSFRILSDIKEEDWARDLLDIFYMDEELEEWAKEVCKAMNNFIM